MLHVMATTLLVLPLTALSYPTEKNLNFQEGAVHLEQRLCRAGPFSNWDSAGYQPRELERESTRLVSIRLAPSSLPKPSA